MLAKIAMTFEKLRFDSALEQLCGHQAEIGEIAARLAFARTKTSSGLQGFRCERHVVDGRSGCFRSSKFRGDRLGCGGGWFGLSARGGRWDGSRN